MSKDKYNIEQLNNSKSCFENAKDLLTNAKTKLETIYESINSGSFSGFDYIKTISINLEKAIEGIDRVFVNIDNAKSDIDIKIKNNNK